MRYGATSAAPRSNSADSTRRSIESLRQSLASTDSRVQTIVKMQKQRLYQEAAAVSTTKRTTGDATPAKGGPLQTHASGNDNDVTPM